MSVTLYHNPRCSKSRQTLALLREKGINPDIIFYLENPPTTSKLETLLQQLQLSPRSLIRTGEQEYKDNNLSDPSLSDAQLIKMMSMHPRLIQRPIVVSNNHARIGRPPEAVLEIIDQ